MTRLTASARRAWPGCPVRTRWLANRDADREHTRRTAGGSKGGFLKQGGEGAFDQGRKDGQSQQGGEESAQPVPLEDADGDRAGLHVASAESRSARRLSCDPRPIERPGS